MIIYIGVHLVYDTTVTVSNQTLLCSSVSDRGTYSLVTLKVEMISFVEINA